MAIGIVSGLRRETHCLTTPGTANTDNLTFSGVGPERAEAGARELIAKGAEALVSFGVSGGIAPEISAGTLILARAGVFGDTIFETTTFWRQSLKDMLPPNIIIEEGPIVGVDKMIASPEAKQRLHANTGALACDMESHTVAQVAAEVGLPFIAVRAISDPAGRDVPKWVLHCLSGEGDVDYQSLILALARRPWALPALMALAGNSKKAFGALRRVARAAGPSLGFSGGR